MSAVDFIFDTGNTLIQTYTKVADWFVTPLYYSNGTDFPDWLLEWVGTIIGADYIGREVAVTPISVIAGSGVAIVLTYMFAKWVLPIFK